LITSTSHKKVCAALPSLENSLSSSAPKPNRLVFRKISFISLTTAVNREFSYGRRIVSPTAMAGLNDRVFNDAREQFLATLSDQERNQFSKCTSAAALLQDIERFGARFKQKGILSRIKSFTDHLQPYFEILGIVVQSNPEWAAIAWGAFRLVLQVR
jgi:hypothetical protein